MSTCSGCGAAIGAGALLCGGCGMPAAIGVPVVSSAAPRAGVASGLSRVESGIADKRPAIELPRGDFSWTLGRHDLVARPPNVVDIDLGPLCTLIDLADGSRGFAVSRRHAVLARTGGTLTLRAQTDGSTFVRRADEADFAPLDAGAAQVIEVGARIVLGARSPLILEVV